MDIVIPLGRGGKRFKDIELEFALFSIEKHLKGYGKIFIVGEKPSFGRNGYTLIPAEDTKGRKQYSLMNKLMVAAEDERISENFIYWHDDHFLLKPLNVSEIKPWYSGTMKDALLKSRGNYSEAIKNTIEVLGEDALYYDLHVPCVFSKKRIRIISQGDWTKEFGYAIKSLYHNTFPEQPEFMTDCKINQPMTREGIEERIKDRLFFSIGQNGLGDQMRIKLKELYTPYDSNEARA